MIISVSNKDKETLKDLSKYIWWQDNEPKPSKNYPKRKNARNSQSKKLSNKG